MPVVVAVNRFAGDADAEVAQVAAFCAERGVACAITDAYARGGEGALELAEQVVEATSGADADPRPLYPAELRLTAKVETVAREIYGADGVYFEGDARRQLEKFEALGFGRLPVCMAKTQSSLSDDPKAVGAPRGLDPHGDGAHLAAGAGFIVVIAGNMLLMPGLGKEPQAIRMDVDDDGRITGLR